MKILGHIHTYNDEDVINSSLASLLRQTYPVDKIVIVDNASTDRTLQRAFPDQVTIIRHSENLGTSGAVVSGMKYALDYDYDWIWIFDADSAPCPDALEQLLNFYHTLSASEQKKVQRLCSLGIDAGDERAYPGIIFTPYGYEQVRLSSVLDAYQCHGLIWSGSLFQVDTVRKLGLPSEDYVLDWGEFEYGYQSMRRGFTTYVVPSSQFQHNIGILKSPSRSFIISLGPFSFTLTHLPPIRLYYLIRNTLYFWLHVYHHRSLRFYLQVFKNTAWAPKYVLKALILGRWKDCLACLRGMWDGVSGNMRQRY